MGGSGLPCGCFTASTGAAIGSTGPPVGLPAQIDAKDLREVSDGFAVCKGDSILELARVGEDCAPVSTVADGDDRVGRWAADGTFLVVSALCRS